MSHKTQQERDRITIDIMTKTFADHERRQGKEVNDEKIRKKVIEIANRVDKKRK